MGNIPAMTTRPPQVIELRRYRLHPGQRETLITLFEREFIDSQQAVGLQVLGIFREPAQPDHFVWLRGFAGMAERRVGLQAFYGGPVWQTHRDAANATMVDSDDVLLLRPLSPWPAAPGPSPDGHWHMRVVPLVAPLDDAQRDLLRQQPGLWLDSEPAENDFPRLPVRSGLWLLALDTKPPVLPAALQAGVAGARERLCLTPTDRSPLR